MLINSGICTVYYLKGLKNEFAEQLANEARLQMVEVKDNE